MLAFWMILLYVIAIVMAVVSAFLSKVTWKARSVHGIQFYTEWAALIALMLDMVLLYPAYFHWPTNSHQHGVFLACVVSGAIILVIVWFALQQVRNRAQGNPRRLPQ